jgi:radical SAM superfamily enzyme YgiQ (UPF0313 family)
MRVLLINPWGGEEFPVPSIGYLQAALKHWKVDVVAKDLNLAMIDNDSYDLIGVSFHSFSVKYARQIRDKFKGKLICGGHHPSAMPEQMFSVGYDQIVIGEGENAIIDIIQGNDAKIIKDCDNKYFPGINEIPFSDYEGLGWNGLLGFAIISSRGCPFDCNFCASSSFWKRKWKGRSPDDILREIELRIRQFGIKIFMFEDDNFILDKKRTLEICGSIKDLHLIWQCSSRADTLNDDDICRALIASGCHTVWIGIESLSEESLIRMNKRIDVETILRGIDNAYKFGLQVMAEFIVGLPGDTENDIITTVKNIKRSKINKKAIQIAWIIPETEIYKKAKEQGFNDNVYLESGAPFYTYEQDINTLNRWYNLIDTA